MVAESPIAKTAAGAPLLYEALGVVFHLEPLLEEDGDRLRAACDRVTAWIGPRLRFAWSSVHPEVVPFTPDVLDLAAGLAAQLRDTTHEGMDARARAGTRAMLAAHIDKLGVACHGGAARNEPSPWSFRFFASVSPPSGDGQRLRADSMIALTVPRTTPLAELETHAIALAETLRIRWGAAGLAFGAWELDRYGETRDAVYAHARRHPGFDVGQHTTWMRTFHDRLRTVSWLTFVGADMAARASAGPEALASDELVTVKPLDGGFVLRAGERPEPGDVNRRDVPRAYARADRMVRAIRASDDVHFYAPWSASTTTAWLRRFEE